MSRNPLTNEQKYAIQGMLYDQKSVDEISKELGRQKRVIQNYIENELDGIHETIARIQLEQSQAAEEAQENPEPPTTKKRKPINDLFLNKTASGTKGLAINNAAASQKSDALKMNYKNQTPKRLKGNIYKIDEEEVM